MGRGGRYYDQNGYRGGNNNYRGGNRGGRGYNDWGGGQGYQDDRGNGGGYRDGRDYEGGGRGNRGGGRNTGGRRGGNPYEALREPRDSRGGKGGGADEVTATLQQELHEQNRPWWILSCYAHAKCKANDLVGDLSFEELRWRNRQELQAGKSPLMMSNELKQALQWQDQQIASLVNAVMQGAKPPSLGGTAPTAVNPYIASSLGPTSPSVSPTPPFGHNVQSSQFGIGPPASQSSTSSFFQAPSPAPAAPAPTAQNHPFGPQGSAFFDPQASNNSTGQQTTMLFGVKVPTPKAPPAQAPFGTDTPSFPPPQQPPSNFFQQNTTTGTGPQPPPDGFTSSLSQFGTLPPAGASAFSPSPFGVAPQALAPLPAFPNSSVSLPNPSSNPLSPSTPVLVSPKDNPLTPPSTHAADSLWTSPKFERGKIPEEPPPPEVCV